MSTNDDQKKAFGAGLQASSAAISDFATKLGLAKPLNLRDDKDYPRNHAGIPQSEIVEAIYKCRKRSVGGPGRNKTGQHGEIHHNCGDWPYHDEPGWFDKTKAKIVQRYGPGNYTCSATRVDGKAADKDRFPDFAITVDTPEEAMEYGWISPEQKALENSLDSAYNHDGPPRREEKEEDELRKIEKQTKIFEAKMREEEMKAEYEHRKRQLEQKLNGKEDAIEAASKNNETENRFQRILEEQRKEREALTSELKEAKLRHEQDLAKKDADFEKAKLENQIESLKALVTTSFENKKNGVEESLRIELSSMKDEIKRMSDERHSLLTRPSDFSIEKLAPIIGGFGEVLKGAIDLISKRLEPPKPENTKKEIVELLGALKALSPPMPTTQDIVGQLQPLIGKPTTQKERLEELKSLTEVMKNLYPPAKNSDPLESFARQFSLVRDMAQDMVDGNVANDKKNGVVETIKGLAPTLREVSEIIKNSQPQHQQQTQQIQPQPGNGIVYAKDAQGNLVPGVLRQRGQQTQPIQAAPQAQPQQAQPQGEQPIEMSPKQLGDFGTIIAEAVSIDEDARVTLSKIRQAAPPALTLLANVSNEEDLLELEKTFVTLSGEISSPNGEKLMGGVSALKSDKGKAWITKFYVTMLTSGETKLIQNATSEANQNGD